MGGRVLFLAVFPLIRNRPFQTFKIKRGQIRRGYSGAENSKHLEPGAQTPSTGLRHPSFGGRGAGKRYLKCAYSCVTTTLNSETRSLSPLLLESFKTRQQQNCR